MLISTILVTAAGSTAAFLVYRQNALRGALNVTLAYLEERQKTEERVFEDIRDVQSSAQRLYEQRLKTIDQRAALRAFEALFPLQADGSRRSVDMVFDGGRAADGVNVFGVGSFMANGARMTPEEKLEIYAAYLVLRDMGPIILPRLDNLYFFTQQNRMVMFAPNREDRLSFYRHDAPATFAFQHEEFAVISTTSANPAALTRCTGLRRFITDPTGRRLSSACMTPQDLDGRRVGAWGASITMADGLRASVESALPGTSNAILDRQGGLIAHGDLIGANASHNVAAVSERLGIAQVMDFIRASEADSGVVPHVINGNYVVFARIDGPDWIFLSLVPQEIVARHASHSAGMFFIIGALAVLAQVLLLAFLMYRWVVRPTMRLTEAASANASLCLDDIAGRQDELGELARALTARDQRDAERLNALAEASADAQAASQAKSQFLSAMSHELRTPLNAVIGYTEIMREDAVEAKRATDVADHNRVLAAARRLLHLINEVLDLSKVESGRIQLEIEPANVVELANDALDAIRPQAEANGNELVLEAPANLPLGHTDNFKLGQCLLNLLSNACKFTRNGEIRVRVRHEHGLFVFEVSDTGVGIPADKIGNLFQPFVQADSSTTRTFGGTGLGLAITRRMAQLMGGDVTVESVSGQGSVFTLTVAVSLEDGKAEIEAA
ncbi:ATP-binding protein [Vitreimonas flagellata]|uniref:sensor histidine kinase n=1 Tax=Vitreimonas flagellata TaxID=2560861 RepID=UPI001074CF06|nr:ATP-binding protein [Vitreimonas flagellata]